MNESELERLYGRLRPAQQAAILDLMRATAPAEEPTIIALLRELGPIDMAALAPVESYVALLLDAQRKRELCAKLVRALRKLPHSTAAHDAAPDDTLAPGCLGCAAERTLSEAGV